MEIGKEHMDGISLDTTLLFKFHFERIVGMDFLDGRAYLHEVLIHRFRNIESDGRCRASVAVEQVGDFI